MKIINKCKPSKRATFQTLQVGQTFLYGTLLYRKIDEAKVYCFQDNYVATMSYFAPVIPVTVEVVFRDVE